MKNIIFLYTRSLKYGSVAQLVRASDCIQNDSLRRIKTMFQVFKSSNLYIVSNQRVEGSNPSRSAKLSLLKIKFIENKVAEEEGYIYYVEGVIPKRRCNSLEY